MAVRLQLAIYDKDEAERMEAPATIGFSLQHMTAVQAEAALKYLRPFVAKLEKFLEEEMKKYGDKSDGAVIPEEGDLAKEAVATFTDEDREALRDENAPDTTS